MGLVYCECSMEKVWLGCKEGNWSVIALHYNVYSSFNGFCIFYRKAQYILITLNKMFLYVLMFFVFHSESTLISEVIAQPCKAKDTW